jgi:hypothetical protein
LAAKSQCSGPSRPDALFISDMNVYAEIEGREFDWFAMDRTGRVAMFATAGAGTVPEMVLADYLAHDRVSEAFPVEHFGSERVWDAYARLGLYVYDWDHGKCVYRRLREPTATLPEHFGELFRGLSSLPRFDFDFEARAVIDGVDGEMTPDTSRERTRER